MEAAGSCRKRGDIMHQQLVSRMQAASAKKVLACDGGGIRGLISVEILAKLESHLRAERKQPDLVLSDFFDFVCGTSTGALIASCISAGMSMEQIRAFYVGSGAQMFDKASVFKRLHYNYNDEPLARTLQNTLDSALGHQKTKTTPHATLGSSGLRTLLMMVMRNHSTDSPWPVTNNPSAKYNQPDRKDCNLNLPLWQLLRASTAAPTFFPPELIVLAPGTPDEYQFIFIDGGITTYNNPAFLAFQMVTAAPYKIEWPVGEEQLLIVSVGTGSAADTWQDLSTGDMTLLHHAKNLPGALMNAASAGWDMACRNLGACRFGGKIDREFGDMVMKDEDKNTTNPKLFTYVRYNPELTRDALAALGLPQINPEKVRQLDAIGNIPDLQRIGELYADRYVNINHITPFV
ncbi:MAG: patatin-like phospholipase family protein [Planctomycetales bacterium]|nr:patatin-like phospholipase family protein [Planctomycetales bacterium]